MSDLHDLIDSRTSEELAAIAEKARKRCAAMGPPPLSCADCSVNCQGMWLSQDEARCEYWGVRIGAGARRTT